MNNVPNIDDRLEKRMHANLAGAQDLTAFLKEVAGVRPADRVLDLGCGLGNQVVPLASVVDSVTAVDISRELLDKLAVRLGHHRNVTCVCADMDEAPHQLAGQHFDLVEAVYSLYYSRDISRLVSAIAGELLTDEGRFLTLSPDVGNNAEWFNDLGRIFPVPDDILETSWNSRRRILPHVLDRFDDVRCVRFVNEVGYDSLDALMSYYDGCGHYCPADRRADAQAFFAERFRADGRYVIVKRAMAILGRGPR
jgi:SAM-dependent methyltransferase